MTFRTLLSLAVFCIAHTSQATELIYTPVNPSFGGNPANGSFLLNKAQAKTIIKPARPRRTLLPVLRSHWNVTSLTPSPAALLMVRSKMGCTILAIFVSKSPLLAPE